MDFFSENAFRILGLPITASKRDIIRRVEELQTFISIGQPICYNTDLPWIGEFQRNEETIKRALQVLEDPKIKLSHMISWFWVIKFYDKLAIEALTKKDLNEALKIWSDESKQKESHNKKNLASLELILALQESESDYQHLICSFNYWAKLITSNQLFDLITTFDPNLTNKIDNRELTELVGTYLSQTTSPFLERWADWIQLDKIGKFFAGLSSLDLPTKLVDQIKNDYVNKLSEKIDKLCSEFEDINDDYEKIYIETKTFYEKVILYFEQIKQTGDLFSKETYGDKISEIILNRAIHYGNNTHKWQKSLKLCNLAGNVVSGPLLKDKFEKNLKIISSNIEQETIWGKIKAIKKAPFIDTFYGVGTALYGHSNYDPKSESYEATRYFVILFIPILPLARYRVISARNNYYRFLGKVPFRPFDKWHLGLALVILATIIYILFNLPSSTSSSSYSNPEYSSSSQSTSNLDKPRTKSQEIIALAQKIENAKMKLKTMESELLLLQSNLESYDNKIKILKEAIDGAERKLRLGLDINEFTYKNDIDEYNNLVKKFNATLLTFQAKHKEYTLFKDATNQDIIKYNKLTRNN